MVTTRARAKIRNFLRAGASASKSLKLGRELLEREMHKSGVSLNKLLKNDAGAAQGCSRR